jgi:hypothetical protein
VAVVDGIAALEEKPSIPAFYNEGAVRNVGRAGARREREGIELVTVSAVNGSAHSEAKITSVVVKNATESVVPVTTSIGSVIGTLDVLNARGRELRAGVLESRTRRAVTILFREEQQDEFLQAFGKRVAVSGAVTRNHLGQAVRIRAQELVVLPERAVAARLSDLPGSAPGWTAGVSLDEYVSRARRDA